MWKNSYAVGNDLIDGQHRELFAMTDDLVDAIRRREGSAGPEACARAVAFLKDYTVKHFSDEEDLQTALGYEGLAVHKKLHIDFVATVMDYEKRLLESDFDSKVMQQFAGKVLGWLIYHVVGEDKKITAKVADAARSVPDRAEPAQFDVCFADSACEGLGHLLSIPVRVTPETPRGSEKGDISVSVGLIGDCPGKAEFLFPLVTALRIVQSMAMIEPDEFNDMVESALREIANIVSGSAASKIAEMGYVCDITPPKLYRGQRPFLIGGKSVKCDLGTMAVFFNPGAAQ
jgi:hemerythrin-like metal-binding protein